MLAGLLFATHDADDRPGALTATLPFGGATLIEYQARLLAAVGASQLVVMVTRLTPELIGAINRIGRRGVTVDTVRSAAEAADKLHPLSRVLMLADGLTTTEPTLEAMARDGGDALLVLPEEDARGDYERIGGGMMWAGVARLDPRRLAELARMPRDYDVQSTLVRLASQAHAVHVMLPPDAVRTGHGVEHGGTTLEERGRGVLAATAASRMGWFDRLIVAPVARWVIPMLAARSLPTIVPGAVAVGIGVIALAFAWFDRPVAAFALGIIAVTGLGIGGIVADLRDEPALDSGLRWAGRVFPALLAILYGQRTSMLTGDGAAIALAAAAVVLAGLGDRAGGSRPRSWWGSPPGYLIVLLIGAIVGAPIAGLAVAAGYAAVTVAAAIERLRR